MKMHLKNIQVINISKNPQVMFKRKLLSAFKKGFFIGVSAFLFGTGATILAPQSSASPGFFEYQWDPEPGYKRLKYYQSSRKVFLLGFQLSYLEQVLLF